jgi:hypothetical protein
MAAGILRGEVSTRLAAEADMRRASAAVVIPAGLVGEATRLPMALAGGAMGAVAVVIRRAAGIPAEGRTGSTDQVDSEHCTVHSELS